MAAARDKFDDVTAQDLELRNSMVDTFNNVAPEITGGLCIVLNATL